MDMFAARQQMVDTQVRTSDVTQASLIAAMRTVPREAFTPAQGQALAYADRELDQGEGILAPRARELAKLIQALGLVAGARVLVIGAARGYSGAVLASMGAKPTLWNADERFDAAIREGFKAAALALPETISASYQAIPALAARSFEAILVDGSVGIVPASWLDLLADHGKLAVVVREGPLGRARIYTRSGQAVGFDAVFEANLPALPGLEVKPEFSF